MSNQYNIDHFFSSDVYLQTLAEVYFPNRAYNLELRQVNQHIFRLLVLDADQPIGSFAFLDYLTPIDQPSVNDGIAKIPQIRFLPRVSTATVVLPIEHKLVPTFNKKDEQVAPYVDWTCFYSWDDFITLIKKRSPSVIRNGIRRTKKIEIEKGPVKFTFDDPRTELIELCFSWKRQQFEDVGGTLDFVNPRHLRMFKELYKKGYLQISSLSCKGAVIAINLQIKDYHGLHLWVGSYDHKYSIYSPGRLLLHYCLEQNYQRHHSQYDFLLGDEDYKWDYATHYKKIASVGQLPILIRYVNSTAHLLQYFMVQFTPGLYKFSKKLAIHTLMFIYSFS